MAMRYIKSFSASTDVQNALNDGTLGKPYVAYLTSSDSIDWNTKVSYKEIPLTFEFLGDGIFLINNVSGLMYKINNEEWDTVVGTSLSADVLSGDTIQIKGNLQDWNSYRDGGPVIVANDGESVPFNVYGNVMSVLDADGFATATTLSAQECYCSMFKNTLVVDASNLVLPATISNLATSCYREMFNGCASLTAAPELPATSLAGSCYKQMFYECSSLVTPPSVLPATTINTLSYDSMFYGCTSLETAPEILATTLAMSSCNSMFQGCSSLNFIKCLATNLALISTTNWVDGVAANGTFVKNANMSGWTEGVDGIPSGWTVEDA